MNIIIINSNLKTIVISNYNLNYKEIKKEFQILIIIIYNYNFKSKFKHDFHFNLNLNYKEIKIIKFYFI